MVNESIAISVSDEDPEDLAGKIRPRPRRKRRKQAVRPKGELVRRIVRKLVKWWPVVLLAFVVGLLLFEAFQIGRKPSEENGVRVPTKISERKPPANLGRLDPTFHVVGGVKERCLKILPPKELENLDIPRGKGRSWPIKKLEYIKESNISGSNSTSSTSTGEAGRFNLFTGYQTFSQRQKSFELSATPMVHCGFFSENGGFKISENDKKYMETCKAVVSTCAFGGGDDLYQPIGMSETSLQKVCYVAFWDEVTLSMQKTQDQRVDENGFIGKWRVIIVKDLPFTDQRLNGKIPKMLAHRLFPEARFSIWVDSKSQLRRDPLGVLETLLWRTNSVLAISEHGARGSVYDEAKAVIKKNKATPEEVAVQITQYRKDGLPEDKRFNGKKGDGGVPSPSPFQTLHKMQLKMSHSPNRLITALNEASVIVREHTPLTNLFMCLWFNEVVRFTSRDQLSFPYVLWRLKVLKDVNMFPVCTRKDLVNSMGHVRKAKPLVNLTRSL